jgi:hypothetical protein
MIEIKRIDPDWFQTSNLFFKDDGPVSKGAKTRRFSVLSRTTRSLLGYIKWFPNWRKYCFFPLNSLFDDKCLRQVAQFCEEATTIHKSRLPNIQRQKDMAKARRERRIDKLTKSKEPDTMGSEVKSTNPDSCIPETLSNEEQNRDDMLDIFMNSLQNCV